MHLTTSDSKALLSDGTVMHESHDSWRQWLYLKKVSWLLSSIHLSQDCTNMKKEQNIYSHYDFTYDDINIIEYKGGYHNLDEANKKATSKKGSIIDNVMIGNDKKRH